MRYSSWKYRGYLVLSPKRKRGFEPNPSLALRAQKIAREAFTLIELLVVMSLIAIIATLAVLFFPSAAASAREANAAQQLQAWLNTAKQRALRNQRPAGLRLYLTTATVNANTFPNVVTECQYIEQPDDFGSPTAPIVSVPLGTPPVNPVYKSVNDVVMFGGTDLTNGYGTLPYYNYAAPQAGNPNLPIIPPGKGAALTKIGALAYAPSQIYWTVQPCPFINTGKGYYPYSPNPQGYGGDYIEFFNNGMMHQVVAVLTQNMVQIAPPLQSPIGIATTNYRIVRSPRVVGSETLTLPESTFIDLVTNVTFNNPLPNLAPFATNAAEVQAAGAAAANSGAGFVDILFSPSGQVITPGVATSNINLWVRCPSETSAALAANPFQGDPTIVSVFVRTGFVGAYPPVVPSAANGGDPYFLVR